MESIENKAPLDIMHYESDIWSIADLLIAASVKQSDFPAYMMPFFALMMLEGRMLNAVKTVEEEEGLTAADDSEDFKEAYLEMDCGYNEYIVMQGKTLSSICKNDTTFDQDFSEYLNAFDDVLKRLLGISRNKTEQKFLNMDGIVAELRGKKILMSVVTAWAKIDLSAYDNSAITTLEEHIKRKWADISASTAGEQYTPDDIISLIAEIVATKVNKPKNQYVHIYDPTCGGANLLYGVADRLNKVAGYENIATYGSEYNDALYALAAIESRFRDNSEIHYGNTLTTVPFESKAFDVVVANPPYGTKWSGYEKEIKKDERGQFPGGLPAVSDGQLLFMQHILWQLADTGIAVEVHNGSTLFSGDAGGGESNIRKYIFDHDWVEAIIQMPQQEFFNTGIYTYLWIMNKNKPTERRDKVILIDGSKEWAPLKKSKGDKRREMLSEHRQKIVDAFTKFEESDIAKIFDREHFYYNKQDIVLTDISDKNISVQDSICPSEKPFTIKNPVAIVVGELRYDNLAGMNAAELKELSKTLADCRENNLDASILTKDGASYSFDHYLNTIYSKNEKDGLSDLGCGDFTIKVSAKLDFDSSFKVQIIPHKIKDYEIIPHAFDSEQNQKWISDFMDSYVFKPFEYGRNLVGVELNFNKEFYTPECLDSVDDIKQEIEIINEQLATLENSLAL